MPDLLFEIYSEEMPAGVQEMAANNLLSSLSAEFGPAANRQTDCYWTPRRLIVFIAGLPATTAFPDLERRGPRVTAPQAAIDGFLKAVGSRSVEQLEIRDGVYFAVTRTPDRPTIDILPERLCKAMLGIPWPKSMRWRDTALAWTRPLHGLMAVFGDRVPAGGLHLGRHNERAAGFATGPDFAGDPNFVPFTRVTRGHRFMAPAAIEVATADLSDFRAALRKAKVEIDPAQRRARINAIDGPLPAPLRVVGDGELVLELVNLTEWPVPLVGAIDDGMMDLPREVLTTTMRNHQRYLAIEDDGGRLAPHFVAVADGEPPDRGIVIAGFERVLRARLADARFFWDQDRRTPLEAMLDKLKTRQFHAQLGTVYERALRLETIATQIAARIGDMADAKRAGRLAKADLSSAMVGEFPELQGVIGAYCAALAGQTEIAEALRTQYWPAPGAAKPHGSVALAVNLADKFDLLAGFFSIGDVPTGSRDPYALRRAALGVIRLILDYELRLPLRALFADFPVHRHDRMPIAARDAVLAFIYERLRVHLREEGRAYDLVAAVLPMTDDLVEIRGRVQALQAFRASEGGRDLLAGYKRAANILRIEEAKDGIVYEGPAHAYDLKEAADRDLLMAINANNQRIQTALERHDHQEALHALSALQQPLTDFFAAVTVNDDNPELRRNRLKLLAHLRATFHLVADFSVIEGA